MSQPEGLNWEPPPSDERTLGTPIRSQWGFLRKSQARSPRRLTMRRGAVAGIGACFLGERATAPVAGSGLTGALTPQPAVERREVVHGKLAGRCSRTKAADTSRSTAN